MKGSDGTREDTQDTTMLVQIEEVMSAIRTLSFVTKLSLVDTHKDKVAGRDCEVLRVWVLKGLFCLSLDGHDVSE
jgi:hypothetical protein